MHLHISRMFCYGFDVMLETVFDSITIVFFILDDGIDGLMKMFS